MSGLTSRLWGSLGLPPGALLAAGTAWGRLGREGPRQRARALCFCARRLGSPRPRGGRNSAPQRKRTDESDGSQNVFPVPAPPVSGRSAEGWRFAGTAVLFVKMRK